MKSLTAGYGSKRNMRMLSVVALSGVLCLGAGAIEAAESASTTGLDLPFIEGFDASALDPGWTVHTGPESGIAIQNGAARFTARSGNRAHIERGLDRDLVRVSAKLKSSGEGGAVSIFAWWDASNFVQVGLNREGSGRMEARVALGNYPHDYDLGPWAAEQWHTVAIEVAQDCIRILRQDEKGVFVPLHIGDRPQRFSAKPALLVAGRDAETKLFPPANPWIHPPATNAIHLCAVDDIRVTALARGRTRASGRERRQLVQGGLDAWGREALAGKADPTFEKAARHFPPLKWPREAIGVKDNPSALGVAADGSLQFSGDIANYKKPVGFFSVDGYRFGSGADACARRLANGYMPMIIAKDRHSALELEQTAFGYSEGFSADQTLHAYVQMKITNSENRSRTADLAFHMEPVPAGAAIKSWSLDLPARGSRTVQVRVPSTTVFPPSPGTSRAATINTVTPGAVEEISAADFTSALERTGAYWEQLISRGSRFEIPETRVQDAYRAWIGYNFLNVSRRGEVFHVCDGSGFYSKVYGYSAALFCNNLDLLGYHDLSAAYLESLLTFTQTNGLLAVNFGSTDTGTALWAISEHYRITRDAGWLRRIAPRMLQMCDWIIAQRQKFQVVTTDHPAITKGLIRYRPYADLLHPAADYFSNGYLWKGMDAAADVLEEIGMREAAARLEIEAGAYRRDILASMEQGIFNDRGMRILPAIPDTRELWKEANGSANGYYGIIAPCMLEAGLPAWNDPKAGLIVDALERRGGLVAGVSRFHDMADHAYAYGYWMNRLQNGDERKAILGLYGSMAYGMSRDTYSAVECTHIKTGENYWTLPHTYSNTQQLRLLRNMLVRENGNQLLLAQAAPRHWLAPGKRLAVNKAPTVFGPVSYSIEISGKSARVRLDPPVRQAPDEIVLHIRHPDFLKIARVSEGKHEGVSFSGETLRIRRASQSLALNLILK